MKKSIIFGLLLLLCAVPVYAQETPANPDEKKEAPSEPSPDYKSPLVWIFLGSEGDEEHGEYYKDVIQRLETALKERYRVKATDITTLYGNSGREKDRPCNTANLKEELNRIVDTADGKRPQWVFFFGHSNPTISGVNFNIEGYDLSARQMGKILKDLPEESPIAFFLTTSSGGKYIRNFAEEGRAIISATGEDEKDNRTDYPLALVQALETSTSDANADGYLTIDEIFIKTKELVAEIYVKDNLLQTEHCVLDGDGDGRGTRKPARRDIRGAEKFRLFINEEYREDIGEGPVIDIDVD